MNNRMIVALLLWLLPALLPAQVSPPGGTTDRLTASGVDVLIATNDGTNSSLSLEADASQVSNSALLSVKDASGNEFFTCREDTTAGESPTCNSFDPDLANWFDSTCIGINCNVTGIDGICIGRDCLSAGSGVAIGRSSNCSSGVDCVAIGDGAAAGIASTAIGDAVHCGDISTSTVSFCGGSNIDAARVATDVFAVALGGGWDGPNTYSSCGGIGQWDRDDTDDCNVDRSFYIGGDFDQGYFEYLRLGRGYHHATPINFTITGTAGDGTDIAAADLTFQVPQGTGTGAPGNIIFNKAPAGSTGSTINAGSKAVVIDGETGLLIPQRLTADPCTAGLVAGIFYNDTSNYMCFCDGTNDVQMHSPATACF